MGQAILLTGTPQVGKTTLIKRILECLDCDVTGFITEEIRTGKERSGFKIVSLSKGEQVFAHKDINSSHRIGKYGVDLQVLEKIVDELMAAVTLGGHQVVVIDEIGPMEILSNHFRQAMVQLLNMDIVLLGTIVKRRFAFTDVIKARNDVVILEVTPDNRDEIFKQCLQLLVSTERCAVTKDCGIYFEAKKLTADAADGRRCGRR